ncbi:MAG TPA: hypothetical protein VN860_06960 [Candidatus Acidoferrales bacterium]|nr:hypothetical protein [Candidatus Acidoferrales bacterium]
MSPQSGAAQSSKLRHADSTEARTDDSPPQFSSGATAGATSFTGGRNEQALSLLLQFRPVSWLSLSAAPGFGRTTFGTLSSNGLTDMPLASAAQYSAATLPWSPAFAGSLSTVLSTGQSGSTLGIGRTSLAAGAALSVSPVRHTYLAADASRPITTGTGNGSADVWISRSLGRVTPSVGYSAEIGTADSAAALARSVAGGVAFSIAYPITLAVDGSHGLSSGAPKWAVSVSLGTAFSGISPLSGGSIFGRLKNAFGSRASSSSGYSKTPNGGSSCRKLGTC